MDDEQTTLQAVIQVRIEKTGTSAPTTPEDQSPPRGADETPTRRPAGWP